MNTIIVWQQLLLLLLFCLPNANRLIAATQSSDDELDDFVFIDISDLDQQQPSQKSESDKVGVAQGVVKMSVETAVGNADNMQNNMIPLYDDWEEQNEISSAQSHIFSQREKLLRQALAKALSNISLRQRFVEVMPILRVLNSQQRLALSALITAQLNAKENQPLKLEEVRRMFGDDKQLLLPLMFDIANLVSSSAFKYLPVNSKPNLETAVPTAIERREYELSSAELREEDDMEGIASEISEEILDPQMINEKLMDTNNMRRQKRAAEGTELVHKLIRAVPLSTMNEEELQRGAAASARMLNINTTNFEAPKFESQTANYEPVTTELTTELSYQQVEDLALANLNASSEDVTDSEFVTVANASTEELLPQPEGLISGPRYRLHGNKVRLVRPKPLASRKRVQVQARPKSGHPAPSAKKCERFTASMCIRTDDYPLEQIMGSIRRHKNAMTALLAEYHEQPLHGADIEEDLSDYIVHNNKRREDEGGTGGSMCQSIVRYARPQKARSASGEWKYIVNTGQHTQTLRLEKCSNPQESCAYLAHHYRSHCAQVYNYHRLLSWDKTRGLHVDIFKVPTCCTCQVEGYRQQFPPLIPVQDKDFTPSHLEPYSTINEDLDYNDEEDEDDLSYHFSKGGFSKLKGREPHEFDANELQSSSKTVRTKVFPPSPTVGSYLSPPDRTEFETPYGYHSAIGAQSKASKNLLAPHAHIRRRPFKSLTSVIDESINEGHVDLEISPSELHAEKEVKLFGGAPPKQRKHIYSVPHTAAAAIGSASSSSRNPSTSSRPYTAQTTDGRPTQQAANTITSHATYGGGRGSRKPHTNRYTHTTAAKTSTYTTASSTTGGTPTAATTVHSSTSSTKSSNFNMNAMYSAKLNSSTGTKRINYNYHPIIDFFEVNTRRALSTTTQPPNMSRYAHTIPKSGVETPAYQSHERRMGFSAVSGHSNSEDTNAWQPLVYVP